MKRKVALLLGSFVALLLLIVVYRFLAGGFTPPEEMSVHPRPPLTTRRWMTDARTGKGLRIAPRDDDGRLKSIYEAKQWNKLSDGSYQLIAPSVQLYQRNGERIHIRGEEGRIYAEEVSGGFEVRRGELSGNVSVFFYRPPDHDSKIEPEPLRIFVDDIRFDNDLLEIETDSRVSMFSPEADIFGEGLSIRWNEAPRELRSLRIARGRYMAVYNVPGGLDVISLPGGKSSEQPGESDTVKAAALTTAPSTIPVRAAALTTVPSTLPVHAASSMPATGATMPASRPVRSKPQNVYRAEFIGDVRVNVSDRRLHGVDRLSLTFDWDRSWRSRTRRSETQAVSTHPAAASAHRAASPPAGPTTAASQPGPETPSEPMIITWTGPLLLGPIGYTERPSRRSYVVLAEGERVILSDPQATAVCGEFVFRHPGQKGTLSGTKAAPVRLELADGQEIVCPTVHFDRLSGRARLEGPGYMARRAAEPGEPASTTQPAERETAVSDDRITWSDFVVVSFGQEKRRRPDGDIDQQQYLKEAEFHGQVCASQEQARIRADKITLSFEQVEHQSDEEPRRTRRPSALLAEGNVQVTDARDAQPLEAAADMLESDLIQRSAVLTGKPARLWQGANSLSGVRIELDEIAGSAAVRGAGTLEFLTTKDLNGVELSQPRPVRVAWSEKMDYSGQRSTASFAGGVVLRSGLDHMECGKMRLLFAKSAATTRPVREPSAEVAGGPASQPAGEAQPRRIGIGLERYSRRRLEILIAEDDVTLQSLRQDGKGYMIQRLQLTGQRLIYDARSNEMNVFGAGTLLAEDYRPPQVAAGKTDQASEMSEGLQRPSQTVFEWSRSMQLSQERRLVVMDGGVGMVHRSGEQVVLTAQERKELNVPPWGELASGRKSVLVCGKLMARFNPPDKEPAAPATAPSDYLQPGPRLGQLELFSATEKVNLKDGRWRVLGQRLLYHRPHGLAVVWGFLEGEPLANAIAMEEDPEMGTLRQVSSPKIHCYLEHGQITKAKAQKVTGAGVR